MLPNIEQQKVSKYQVLKYCPLIRLISVDILPYLSKGISDVESSVDVRSNSCLITHIANSISAVKSTK